ncbi:MAG: hypothetical protein WBK38_07765 [Bacteroidia bacterium]|jgi:hypothetical protein
MKKIIALFAIVSVFGFVACNNAAETTDEAATEETMEAPAEEVEVTEEAPATEEVTEEAPAAEVTEEVAH